MNEIIAEALDNNTIENFYISKGTFKGECAVYTFSSFPCEYADNERKGTEYRILVNVYAKAENIDSLKEKVIKALNDSGIKGGRTMTPNLEKDNLYNIPITFNAFKRK